MRKCKHGMYKTRFYSCWRDMINRCRGYTKHSRRFYNGITYDESWSSFIQFKKDMFDSYRDDLTLDRIDNSKGYSKDNCRWATRQEQSDNRRATKKITFNGITMSLVRWSERQGLKPTTVSNRIHVRRMTPLQALELI